MLCPWCGQELGSFFLKRFPGSVFYQCYRASCNKRGKVRLDGEAESPAYEKTRLPEHFTRPTWDLPADVAKDLQERYELGGRDCTDLRLSFIHEQEALYLPIRQDHKVVAHWLKVWPPETRTPFPKNDVVVSDRSWHGLYIRRLAITAPTIVVEDPLSAIKASYYGNAVALLGTSLKPEQVHHLQALGDTVICCLDPGAEHAAASMLSRFGGYFDQWHNVYLPDDLKRVPHAHLAEVFKGF